MRVDDIAREMQLVARAEAAEARLAKAERALEEAKAVIKPFAFEADQWHEYAEIEALVVDAWATSLNVGHLRAARKWMESRCSPPKEG